MRICYLGLLLFCLAACTASRGGTTVGATSISAATPGKDRCLHELERAVASLRRGRLDAARDSLDSAIAEISSVFSNREGATAAISKWYSEAEKDYKGEPYERAMAFYYRGMLYSVAGEFDNARAAFKAGLLQDAFAEEQQYRADFELLVYLEGFAAEHMQDAELARQAWDELARMRPSVPQFQPGNKLVIVETGGSPRKVSDGIGHWQLKYRRAKGEQPRAVAVTGAGAPEISIVPVEDIFWQATTRGGRVVDSILKGKAQFQKNSAGFGSALSDIGRIYQHEGAYLEALGGGGGLSAIGAVGSIVGTAALALAVSANPEADTRYWSALPDLVHVGALAPSDSLEELSFEVEFSGGGKAIVRARDALIAKTEALEWYRIPSDIAPGRFVRRSP